MPNLHKTNKRKPTSKTRTVPDSLLKLHFDDGSAWLIAYAQNNTKDVCRAMVAAFRRRYFLSQSDAANKIGVSANTINKWENGSQIRWRTKQAMLASGWFKPFHFGLDASPSEFISEA